MNLCFIFIANKLNYYIFYTVIVNNLGIKSRKDKVKPEGSQLSPFLPIKNSYRWSSSNPAIA